MKRLIITISSILIFICHLPGQSANENFNQFIDSFVNDSIFQINRIKFPLTFITLDYDTYEEIELKIEMKDWKFDRIYMPDEYRAQIYDNFDYELRDSDERIFSWHGIENGINIHYYFKRIEGKWFLIKFEDTST